MDQKVKVDRVWAVKIIIIRVSPVVFLGGQGLVERVLGGKD